VAFDNPSFATTSQVAAANAVFTLHKDRDTALREPDSISRHYVIYFSESLRGLAPGAPVTLLGLPGGEVLQVGLDIDPAMSQLRGRVEIVLYPERILRRLGPEDARLGEALRAKEQERVAFFQRLVQQRGLRAQLQSGSLLTGQLYVAFDFHPDAPKAKVNWAAEKPELPAVRSTIPELQDKLTNIIAKLDQLPLDKIGVQLTEALGTLNVTLRDASALLTRVNTDVTPELKPAVEDLRRMIATADSLLKSNVALTLTQVNTTLEELRKPIATADTLLKNTDATLLGQNAPMQQELRDALQEMTQALRSLRVFLDYLDRHPEALIRGKTEVKP